MSLTKPRLFPLLSLLTMAGAGLAMAQEETPTTDTGDTAWMMTSMVLVLLMTLPGLALFYGGLVRAKNVLSILVQCMAIAGLMSIIWMIYGYSVASTEGNLLFGGFSKLFLKGLTPDAVTGTIPESVFITFQATFIIITPALIIGAFAERIKFAAVVLFTALWATFSYVPIWHMAWSGSGLFSEWGVLDFAGGTVVHINAGIAGLVGCILCGKRKGFGTQPLPPHNVPFTVIGAALLWVGWFGFNAGSAGGANANAGYAMLTTQLATATAVVVWLICELIFSRHATAVGGATGAVAGLVAITPAAGSTDAIGSVIIGAAAAFICYLSATGLKRALKYDDSLDVFGVHGVGGIVGAILTGVFVRPDVAAGIENFNVVSQVIEQVKSVGVTIVWSTVVSVVALLICKFTVGLRINESGEEAGLDTTSHGESAYSN